VPGSDSLWRWLLQMAIGPWVALFLCFPAMADWRLGVSYQSQMALWLV
jgi:hypothetical protein